MSHAQTGERTWIDEVADRFEHAWKRETDRPRIEDFLAGHTGPARRGLLIELLRLEREFREDSGEKPAAKEYLERFPDDRAAVDAAFGITDRPRSVASPPQSAARSLLFGLLALQNNFIDRETLLAAFNAWVADKAKPMGQILLDRGALNPARHAALDVLVQEHLQQHGHDPELSLAVLNIVPEVRNDLEVVPDLDLQASLLYLRLVASTDVTTDRGEATGIWEDSSAAADPEGRFQIVRLHDRGALGEVFVARDQQLHRIVALKRIKQAHSGDEDKRARFVVEAEITGRLEHPGIVPVYGLGAYDDGRPFYAMRFIRGDNLKAAIEQFHQEEGRGPGARTLALQKLLRRFLDVCNAIDYAHSRGVLHRDLKPGNIMLGKYGETLVVDWGLAKTVGSREHVPAQGTLDDHTLIPQSGSDVRGTEFGARLGTPAYMSPEQAAGRIAELGPASDVYSLGATLYCLLTGKAPFTDTDILELLRKVERGDFPPPRKLETWIDAPLEAICLKAMATDPAQRYRTPRALADDVEHWLADEPVSAWREPLRRRLRRWGRRHRLVVTGLAATLLVAVAALTVGNLLVARQRDIAERNLAFARTVVDEMYTGVADKLDDQNQMDDYQREILEKALTFYERFALPQSRDPLVRLEAARAGLRVGVIRSRLGQTAAAEQADRQALEMLSRLVADHPAEAAYRDSLAQAHQDLGVVFRREERWPEAERELKEAATLWGALVREKPEIAEYLSKLVVARNELGTMYRLMFRIEEAEAEYRLALNAAERLAKENPEVIAYQDSLADTLASYSWVQEVRHDWAGSEASMERAIAIRDTLARDHPEVPRHRKLLGRLLKARGYRYALHRKFPQAEEALKRSISILEQLAKDHPLDFEVAAGLADTYANMMDSFLVRGDLQSAVEWAGRAIPLKRVVARRDPGNLSVGRTQLATTLAARAETFMRLGRHAEALADFEEILELTRRTKDGDLYRAFHGLTKARLGDLSALQSLGDQVRETVKVGAGDESTPVFSYYMSYFDGACIHAALSKLSLEQRGKPATERERLSRSDLDRALELLDKARTAGEFRGMIRLEEVRREKLLDPLRSHPRFQLLMMDLAFPENPFDPKPASKPEAGNRTSPTSQPRENSGSSPAPIASSPGG